MTISLDALFDSLPMSEGVVIATQTGHGVFDHIDAALVLAAQGPIRACRTVGLAWNRVGPANVISPGPVPRELARCAPGPWITIGPGVQEATPAAEVDRKADASGDDQEDELDEEREPALPIAPCRILRRVSRSPAASAVFLVLLAVGEAGRLELVRTSRLSLSTVKRGLRVLRAAGAITRTQRPGQRAVFRVRPGLCWAGSQMGQAARRSGR